MTMRLNLMPLPLWERARERGKVGKERMLAQAQTAISERYSFRYAVYHAVLYDRLTETQRVRLHRRIAKRKEAAYGERAGEVAAELAAHFEVGRDLKRAIPHLRRARENGRRRQFSASLYSFHHIEELS
jgi:predicted ATPase